MSNRERGGEQAWREQVDKRPGDSWGISFAKAPPARAERMTRMQAALWFLATCLVASGSLAVMVGEGVITCPR